MQIIADFHLHSKFSGATSTAMNLENLTHGAKIKGLNLLGTGDFTHPLWLKELKTKLKIDDEGVFNYDGINFILTTELTTIFEFENKIRKIHHLIHAPSFEVVDQINEALSRFGDLKIDGRPTLNISAPELVEILIEIYDKMIITPAHAWTPWFSIFGSKFGFNTVEECYQDKAKHIFSIETGLSSDPKMNWRISALDKYTLVSNSDAHSPAPWRLGREANVFDLEKLSFDSIFKAIKYREKFLYTIEVDPNYGKYHFDGHRNCNVVLNPKETKKLNGVCPVCNKKLTIGVLHRVETLADRDENYVPKNAIGFKTILPLYEIISVLLNSSPFTKKVSLIANKLIEKFGNEFNVLLNADFDELKKIVDEKIARAIMKVRNSQIKYLPGYDGVYGKPILFENQKTLFSF